MSDPTRRTLALLSMLQTHRFWPGPELAERLEVSERTLRRDIDRLRELGYPVDASRGIEGGYRLAAGSHLPPLLLDDDEAVAIAVGLRAAAGAAIEGIEDTALRAMAKLEQVLPDRLRRRVDAVHANVAVMRWATSTPDIPADDLVVLTQGCRDREEVRFDYQRRDGEESRRLVQPHQLVSAGRRWYLVAWDVRREDWRTFRVDRMVEPRLAGVRFPERTLPADDAASFVAASLSSMPMAHTATATVRASPQAVVDVARWVDADVEPLDDGRCRVALRSDSVEWLVSMVVILATHFELDLDAPSEVTDRVAATCDRLAGV